MLVVGVLGVISMLLGVASMLARRQERAITATYAAKAKTLDDFCRATRVAHETALFSLEDEHSTRAIVAELIERDAIYFGYTSVRTCLARQTPETPDGLGLCQLQKDYACIAKQMRARHGALVQGGW